MKRGGKLLRAHEQYLDQVNNQMEWGEVYVRVFDLDLKVLFEHIINEFQVQVVERVFQYHL